MSKKFLSCLLACSLVFSAFGMTAWADAETETEASTEAAADGELSDDLYSFQVKLDGELYQFPMSYADFVAKDWTCVDDDTTEMAPNNYSSFRFTKGNLEAYVDIINVGINTVAVSECMVGGISIDSFQFEDAPDTTIELPKGITYGVSTMDDIKAAYGEASDTYESDLYTKLTYEYDSYQEICLYVDAETGLLNEFDIQNFVVDYDANNAAAAEVSSEPTAEVLAYEAPAELGEDPKSGIVEFAGNLYQLPAPVSVFIENGFTLKSEDSDSVVAGQDFGWFEMLKDGQEFRGTARNFDKNATTIENCFVTEVEADSYDADFELNIPGGISKGMSGDDLLTLLADLPYEVSSESDTHTYYTVQQKDNYDWSINIVVEKESNTVISIEYENREKA